MDFLLVWSWFAAVLGTAPQAFSRDAGMRDATLQEPGSCQALATIDHHLSGRCKPLVEVP